MLGVRRKIKSADGECPASRRSGSLRSWSLWVVAIAAILALVASATADLDIDDEHAGKWDCPACKGESNATLAIFDFLSDNPTSVKTQDLNSAQQARADMEAGKEEDKELNSAQQARADMEAGKEETEDLNSAQQARADMEAARAEIGNRSYVHGEYLISAEDAEDADVILDVGSHYETSHIKGAIPLYWEELLDENNNPKSADEMAEIFGDAGISPEDSVVIYGRCEPCDDISVAPFVFWAMRYIGHDDVMVLDGGLDAWISAGLETETIANARPAANYTPQVRSGLLATYDEVASGEYQLIDARILEDFATYKIAGAIHIDYDEVQKSGIMKGSDDLADVFAGLDEDVPIVVYSYAGARAAMVWLALQLMGYESSVYSFNDWEENSPPVKAILKDARADPNPARPGPVNIYAHFEVVLDESSDGEISTAEAVEEETTDENATEGGENVTADVIIPDGNISEGDNGSVDGTEIEEIISEALSVEEPTVKTMGCVACFDPVTLYASGSNPSNAVGGIKLGMIGSSDLAPITAAGALIQDSEGEVVATIELESTLSGEYLGTWDATGASDGNYTVTLAAAAGGKTAYFEDVLTIEIDSSVPVEETTTDAATNGVRKLGSY
ncbi:MAG TPA: rhodanese-like domain-containing protein [Methanothrix sp.]|nr:rhodanese-like domain-containing protein [Methanothrix sp.]HRW81930.1 rhodanese-like domain-containing protein [Methanothrix sp.]